MQKVTAKWAAKIIMVSLGLRFKSVKCRENPPFIYIAEQLWGFISLLFWTHEMPSVMQQQGKGLEVTLSSGTAACPVPMGGKRMLMAILAWVLSWTTWRSWARPSHVDIWGWGDDCLSSTNISLLGAHQGGCYESPGSLPPSWDLVFVCTVQDMAPWVPLPLALPQGSSGRWELHRQTHSSAGGFDVKVKNSNQTISFSSFSEAGNNDLSHMFQTWESTSVTCF